MSAVTPVIMPKWGLSMSEGLITSWSKRVGEPIIEGEDLVEIETSKIANVYEAPFSGVLRRIIAREGETVPVGGLIAIAADKMVSEAELDAFIAEFQSRFVPEEEDDAAEAEAEVVSVSVGTRTIRVQITGVLTADTIPALLIHGYSGDLNNWLFNISALGARGPVIALDLPGHGASSKHLDSGSLQELADVVAATLKVLEVGRCNAIGHSLGAAVVMRVAIDHPHLVRKLVLVAPAALPGTEVNAAFLDGVAQAQTIRELKPLLGLLFDDGSMVTREMTDELMKFKRLDGADEALAAIARQMITGDDFRVLHDQFGELPDTTLILGRGDRVVGQPDLAALPSAWRVIEVDAGHMPHMERASEFNAAILEALP